MFTIWPFERKFLKTCQLEVKNKRESVVYIFILMLEIFLKHFFSFYLLVNYVNFCLQRFYFIFFLNLDLCFQSNFSFPEKMKV